MRLCFQSVLIVVLLSSLLLVGVVNIYSPTGVLQQFYGLQTNNLSAESLLAFETQSRLLAGLWLAAGLVGLFAVKHFERHTLLLQTLFLGLSLAAIGECITVVWVTWAFTAVAVKCVLQVLFYWLMEGWRRWLVRRGVDTPQRTLPSR